MLLVYPMQIGRVSIQRFKILFVLNVFVSEDFDADLAVAEDG